MTCNADNRPEFYDLLVHNGTIEPLITPGERAFFCSVDWRESITDTELLNAAQDPRAAQAREHSFDKFTPTRGGEGASYWERGEYAELARIVVPSNYLGILRRIDTLLIDATTQQPIADWNNPESWNSVFSFALMVQSYPEFSRNGARLFNSLGGPGDSSAIWRFLPGLPFFQLPQWSDQRYSWGNPSNTVFMPIPKDSVLRLFVICLQSTDYAHQVRGRLKATVQSEESISAQWAARRTATV